jgi:glycosyltransferase involved in cell wall biosynthesis
MQRLLPRSCVLMSVYRGTRFLSEQLESIARQCGTEVHIHARDDGSDDDTSVVFETVCSRLGLSATLERGSNVGASGSFLALIATAPLGYDLYAFADQDDVWEEDKLARASVALSAVAGPALVAAGHRIVNEQLHDIGQSRVPRQIGLGNALVENIVQGAACALNPSGFELVVALGKPVGIIMHDWWLYLVLSALGTVIYDEASVLRYRQHDKNVVGTNASRTRALLQRASHHFTQPPRLRGQASALLELAGERMDVSQRALVGRFLSAYGHPVRQLALAADRSIWRQHKLDDLIMRMLVMAGRY